MAQPRLPPDLLELDSGNLDHLARHGVTEERVWQVFLGPARYVTNAPATGRSGTHLMIGPDAAGRFWTIVLAMVDEETGRWRPITGWPSTRKEERTWRGA